jgi:RNA polymerase sigma-70 factor, ECF subfamily
MDTPDADALDRSDMERLVAGHPDALNQLMDRHATTVFHFLVRMLASEDDANDLTQETFVRVYRARESFRPKERFRTWLFTIAANLARNQLRWRSRHPALSLEAAKSPDDQALGDSLPGNTPSPEAAAQAAERAQAVRDAVQLLPEDQRAAIVLCEWEERSVAEAATILQSTPKAVESRLYRARNFLRQQLQQWL